MQKVSVHWIPLIFYLSLQIIPPGSIYDLSENQAFFPFQSQPIFQNKHPEKISFGFIFIKIIRQHQNNGHKKSQCFTLTFKGSGDRATFIIFNDSLINSKVLVNSGISEDFIC